MSACSLVLELMISAGKHSQRFGRMSLGCFQALRCVEGIHSSVD